MAHNLADNAGRIMMAYSGSTPWHSLGTRMAKDANVAAAMTAAGLDWTVALEPVYLKDGRQVPNRHAVIRQTDPDRIIGNVGPNFRPIQNSDAFAILETACSDHGVTIASAGALENGARTWMLAKMPETVEPVQGDTVNGYFLISNGHDGSLSYSARLTPIRVVCQNTLNAALAGRKPGIVAIRHTANSGKRLDEAHRLVTQMIAAFQETGKTFAQMAARNMTAQEIAAYIETVFPSPEGEPVNPTLAQRRKDVAALTFSGVGVDFAPGSAWIAYNAVTEYFDHVRPAQSKSASARASANESAIFGAGDDAKLRALVAARQLVAA